MSKKKAFLIVFLPVLIFILLRFPSLYESYWYGDEGIYAAVGSEVVSGKKLYTETWDHKPPLIFLIFAAADAVGWPAGLVLLKALSIGFGVLTIFMVNYLLKDKVNNLPRFISLLFLSFFLGSTMLEGNVFNAEVIFIVFNLLGFLLLTRKKYFGLIGFLAYLSLMTKVPGAVEFGLLFSSFLFIYYRQDGLKETLERVVTFGLGFIIPLLSTLFYFYLQGGLTDFVYANIIFNVLYSVSANNTFNLLGLLPILFFSLFAYTKNRISGFFFLVVNLFSFQFFSSLLSGKNYGHYYLQVLTGASLLIGLILEKAKKKLSLHNKLIILIFFIPYLWALIKTGGIGYYAPFKQYYSSFFNGFVLGREKSKGNFWWRTGDGVEKTKILSDYLNKNYLEYETIYIYTDKPWILALTDRKFSNKYVTWFHLGYRGQHLDEEMKNIKNADLVVIDSDASLLERVSAELKTGFKKVNEYQNFNIFIHYNDSND